MQTVGSLTFTERVFMLLRRSPLWVSSLVLLLPAILWYAVFFLAPLGQMIGISFAIPGPYGGVELGFVLDSYQELANPLYLNIFLVTLRMALIGTFACLIVGYPLAYFLARSERRVATIGLFLLVTPLMVSAVIRTFGWLVILGRRGLVNSALDAVGLDRLPLLYNETAVVIGLVNVFLPFMVLPIFSVVKLIDPRLLEAAATLGSGPVDRFVRVTLPLTMPGIVAGVAFVFSMSVSMYVIPTLLVGDRYKTLSTLIARSFLFMRDRSLGSTVSVVLLVIAVAVVVASALLARRWQPSR